jgi:hypothetical protein
MWLLGTPTTLSGTLIGARLFKIHWSLFILVFAAAEITFQVVYSCAYASVNTRTGDRPRVAFYWKTVLFQLPVVALALGCYYWA